MADLTDEERRMLVEILDLYTDSLPIPDDAEGRDYDAALATLKAKLRESGPVSDAPQDQAEPSEPTES